MNPMLNSEPCAPLPVEPAHRLQARAAQNHWLVTELWSESAVGIVGGEPKCCKSFLALDLAVAVATGKPALRRFSVPTPGRVLLYAAEDAQHIVRARLEGICAAASCQLDSLDVHVITAPTLRLDLELDRERLERTVTTFRPRLLILDPFVRLHRIDENSSGEVAPLLAYLRELQRRYEIAVLLVHHAKKSAARLRAGQALRGSSEFHAWGDSNLYLRRTLTGTLTLTIEHRAAASAPPLSLELAAHGAALALHVLEKTDAPAASPVSLDERITQAIATASHPLKLAELRTLCHVRHTTLLQRLRALTTAGLLLHDATGYRLATTPSAP
jgi:RecA-family ATPase